MQKRVSTLQLFSISERRRYFPDELLFDLIFTHNYYQDLFPPACFVVVLSFVLIPHFLNQCVFKKHCPVTPHMKFRNICSFLSRWTFTIYSHGCQKRERKEERNLTSPRYSMSFFPAAEFIVLIPTCAGKLSSMPYENFKNEALI